MRVPMIKPRISRRRSPRLPIHLSGSLSGRVPRQVTIVDVSLTGCLVQCGSLLDPGAILDLKFALDPDPLAAKVRVADSYLDGGAPAESPRYLAGLEFLSLPPREATRLRRFLEEERRRRRSADGPSH